LATILGGFIHEVGCSDKGGGWAINCKELEVAFQLTLLGMIMLWKFMKYPWQSQISWDRTHKIEHYQWKSQEKNVIKVTKNAMK